MDKTRWQQIENLYYEVLEYSSAAERARFLERECAEDTKLFAEITSLLNSSENSGDFLAESDFSFALQLINKPQYLLYSGNDFGKYKILRFLGCGGMGEVYLARDSTLKRKVALKLLPPNIAADANRIRRFQIEARAASRIVQRNIARVYEVGETEGIHYIAMEFVDGETLRTHLKTGRLSSEQALRIAKQIAAALAAAHKVGVVHRDLKPENIMLRSDGEVKVLDFSLAKLTRRAFPSNGTTTGNDSSFLTNSFKTEPGFLMGTAAYMSPEQARGQEIDNRTDIWSFGVVFYELLKGEPPFRGATGMDTIAAVLTAELNPLDGGTDETYYKLARIIHRALRKEPAERYQSVAELIADLDKDASESSFLAESFYFDNNTVTAEQRINATGEIGAVSDKNLLEAGRSEWRSEDKEFSGFDIRPRVPVIAVVILLLTTISGLWFFQPPQQNLFGQNGASNGKIAFQSNRTGEAEIFTMDANGSNEVNVSNNAASDYEPAWSPDGSKIVFRSSRDDGNFEIYTMNADGSNPERLTTDSANDEHPDWSPDGTKIVFHSDRDGDYEIYVMNADGSNQTRLTNNALSDYAPDWSPDGSKIVFESNRDGGNYEIYVMNADGSNPTRLTNNTAFDEHPAWSPDGSKIAFHSRDTGEIYVVNADGSNQMNISNNAASDELPAWSPDASKIAFGTNRDGNYEIYTMNADGSDVSRITNNTAYENRPVWAE